MNQSTTCQQEVALTGTRRATESRNADGFNQFLSLANVPSSFQGSSERLTLRDIIDDALSIIGDIDDEEINVGRQ
eukprot:scaffold23625_cov137-Cylindrotheca_fusiformis.AAC.8